jgi:hypothetical protein
MAATETNRGGKYILPSLRLSSSDLVIDEVDDLDGILEAIVAHPIDANFSVNEEQHRKVALPKGLPRPDWK